MVAAQWCGPLPPPGALREFDAIIPNGAERIMKMVEGEQAARIEFDRKALLGELLDSLLGKAFGFLLTAGFAGCAVWSVMHGASPVVTVAFLGLPVSAIIGKFLIRKKQPK